MNRHSKCFRKYLGINYEWKILWHKNMETQIDIICYIEHEPRKTDEWAYNEKMMKKSKWTARREFYYSVVRIFFIKYINIE